MNRVIIMGRIGRDIELRYSQGGTAIANISVATDDGWGEKKKTNWHRVKAFGKTAENAEKYLSRGRQVLIEGRVDYDSYEKDGVKVYTTDIIADRVEFVGGGGSEQSGSNQPDPPADYDQSFNDEDIPFLCAWAVLPFLDLLTTWGLL